MHAITQSIRHAIRHAGKLTAVLCGVVLAMACGAEGDGDTARVTIDVRCGSNADCPAGFACAAEAEHGPPTTMCESADAEVSCPPGYETKIGYGQTFCRPLGNAGARASHGPGYGSILSTTRGHASGRTASGERRDQAPVR